MRAQVVDGGWRFRIGASVCISRQRRPVRCWSRRHACCCPAGASAQSALISTDPLAPKLQTDPSKPPRFQKVTKPTQVQFGPPPVFAPASGAGRTGFDSTNSRKKNAKRKPAAANVQAIAPGLPQPETVSPYQKPAADAAYAQAPAAPPGSPPVEIGPIRKLPPKRKAHTEPPDPYAQLGIRAGAFDLYPALELIGGYATNPGAEPSPRGAAQYTIAPELRAQSNWSRHELKADLRGSYTGYSPDESPTLSRPYFNGKVDGRIDVRDTTHIDLGSRVLVSTDNPGSPNLPAGLSKLPVFVTYGGNAGIAQRFNRFELTAKGDAQRTAYQDSQLTDGTTSSNKDRNYNQYGVTLRGGYELMPGVTPFVEVGADTRKHDLATDAFGYQRNSKGFVGNVGTTFAADAAADRRGVGRLSDAQLRRSALRPAQGADRQRLAGVDGGRAQHGEVHAPRRPSANPASPACPACSIATPACNTTTPSAAG